MARTRLRGISIGGIQIGIEVPEIFEWEWPESPVAEFQCLPRDPEVHVGLRVGDPGGGDLGGERYGVGAWTFEVARIGGDWLLALSRRGQRAQLARFDREFRVGEIIVSPDTAMACTYPLRSPLDEWIVLHRTIARGGLVLNASASLRDGAAVLRLGARPPARPGRWHVPPPSLLGRSALIVREERDRLRLFRTPWSESIDRRLAFESRVSELQRVEETEHPWTDLLDPSDAADLLVTHSIVPLCDEALLDRVMRNAQRIAGEARVVEVGERPVARVEAPTRWGTAPMQSAVAPPRVG